MVFASSVLIQYIAAESHPDLLGSERDALGEGVHFQQTSSCRCMRCFGILTAAVPSLCNCSQFGGNTAAAGHSSHTIESPPAIAPRSHVVVLSFTSNAWFCPFHFFRASMRQNSRFRRHIPEVTHRVSDVLGTGRCVIIPNSHSNSGTSPVDLNTPSSTPNISSTEFAPKREVQQG